jgi:hypothetical protein
MSELKPKKQKRDTLIDQIGQPKEQGISAKDVNTFTDIISAQNKTLTDKQTAIALVKAKDIGRPTNYTIELAHLICELIADGNPLRRITKMDGMPRSSTVYEWLLKHEEFAEMYTRAREDQADALADEIVEIADEQPELIPMYDKDGQLIEVKVDSAFLAWQKNRIDARKWTASKLKPRKYSERLAMSGDAENPLQVQHTSEVLETIVMNLQLKRQTLRKG